MSMDQNECFVLTKWNQFGAKNASRREGKTWRTVHLI